MATSNRKGFVPSRHLTGGSGAPRTTLYQAIEARAHALAPGDPVVLSATGAVERLTNATADVSRYLGVVRACYDSNKRPLTHNLPTQAAYLPTSVPGYVDVVDDPDMTFIVECETSIGLSDIGQPVWVVATAPNAATGVSRYHVTRTSVDGSPVLFRVMRISPFDEAKGESGAGNRVEVAVVNGVFK